MNLETFFERLSLNGLGNTNYGDCGEGLIQQEHHKKIIAFINEGLNRICARFLIKSNSVIIEQVENLTQYKLSSKFALSNPEISNYKYIIDSVDNPFKDDVVKILSATTIEYKNHPINDHGNVKSFFTPQPDTLQIPIPISGSSVSIQYQARHPTIAKDGADYLNQEIELTDLFLDMLQSYVIYKCYYNMGGEGNTAEALKYLDMFNQLSIEVDNGDLASQSTITSLNKFTQRGFV